jgi:hypothetical protein
MALEVASAVAAQGEANGQAGAMVTAAVTAAWEATVAASGSDLLAAAAGAQGQLMNAAAVQQELSGMLDGAASADVAAAITALVEGTTSAQDAGTLASLGAQLEAALMAATQQGLTLILPTDALAFQQALDAAAEAQAELAAAVQAAVAGSASGEGLADAEQAAAEILSGFSEFHASVGAAFGGALIVGAPPAQVEAVAQATATIGAALFGQTL